jgi:hypothetical protein
MLMRKDWRRRKIPGCNDDRSDYRFAMMTPADASTGRGFKRYIFNDDDTVTQQDCSAWIPVRFCSQSSNSDFECQTEWKVTESNTEIPTVSLEKFVEEIELKKKEALKLERIRYSILQSRPKKINFPARLRRAKNPGR